MARRVSTQVLVGMAAAGFIAGVMVVGAFVPSDDPGETAAQDLAYLRVAHASADAPALEVSVDDESVLAPVSFGDVGPYLALPAGSHTVTVTAVGAEPVQFEGTVSLDPRTVTTVAAFRLPGTDGTAELGLRSYTDDPLQPAQNDSAVRVVSLSSVAPSVDVTTADGSLVFAENVTTGNASDYATVPAGEYTLEVRAAAPSADGPVIAAVPLSLASGTAYSVLTLETAPPDDAPAEDAIDVVLVEDASTSIHLPDATPDNSAAGPVS